jgi:hypothetical protein
MEKLSLTIRVKNEDMLQRVMEERASYHRIRNVVYIVWFMCFLKRRNVRFYLRVMYKLLHCPEIA